VPAEQRAEWEKKDPIDAYRRFLIERRVVDSAEEIDEIDAKIVAILETAANEALSAPFPDPSIARENVYG
jgi:TPP-dependent pyruvate/acetoin dehydrogenase alpha subunit